MRCSESRNKPQVPYQDDERDRQARDRVEPGPAEPERERGGGDDAGRDRRVGGHVQERAARVQVVVAAAQEQQRGARR